MKRAALIVAITAFPLVVSAASQNTLIFKGEVAAQTCEVTIDGTSATVVVLPTVSEQELKEKTQAGDTTFSVMLSNCSGPKSDTPIRTQFLGTKVTQAGNLGNTGGTASGVSVQLVAPNGKPVTLSGLTPVEGLVLKEGSTSAESTFSARYVTEGNDISAGSVSASVQYSISYL